MQDCHAEISKCLIVQYSNSDRSREKNYWICKRIEGIFPKKLSLFKNERIRQKQLGNTVKQLALKILINGGYGVFGSRFFKYYDPRVAELITAYGRYTLTKMQEIAKEMGLNVVVWRYRFIIHRHLH